MAGSVRPPERAADPGLPREGRTTYDVQKRQATYSKCATQMYETAWWGRMWIQPYNYLTKKNLKISSPSTPRTGASGACGSPDLPASLEGEVSGDRT